jgi:hypothetical protein
MKNEKKMTRKIECKESVMCTEWTCHIVDLDRIRVKKPENVTADSQ